MELQKANEKAQDKSSIDFEYQKLDKNLEELTTLYRQLLEVVRTEKDLLIGAQVEKLDENNQHKESLIFKIRAADSARERYARDLAMLLKTDFQNPRLVEIARVIGGKEGDRLRNHHAALEILINRLTVLNKENAEYAQSALSTLGGAIGDIKQTLSGSKVYGQKGKMNTGPEQAGNFVSKEA